MVEIFLSIRIYLTGPHRVVDVYNVVLLSPGEGVDPDPVQVSLLVHSCQHWPMQLEGSEHGGGSWASLGIKYLRHLFRHYLHLKPNNNRGCFWVVECGEEPEEHIAIVRWVHCEETGVAL